MHECVFGVFPCDLSGHVYEALHIYMDGNGRICNFYSSSVPSSKAYLEANHRVAGV